MLKVCPNKHWLGCYSVYRHWRKPYVCFELWKFGQKSKKLQITDWAALSATTDLVMALCWQQVIACNSLVSCSNVIACCCSYQTHATFMSRFLSLPYSNPWQPLQSKQKLHEECSSFVVSYLGKEFAKQHRMPWLPFTNQEKFTSIANLLLLFFYSAIIDAKEEGRCLA